MGAGKLVSVGVKKLATTSAGKAVVGGMQRAGDKAKAAFTAVTAAAGNNAVDSVVGSAFKAAVSKVLAVVKSAISSLGTLKRRATPSAGAAGVSKGAKVAAANTGSRLSQDIAVNPAAPRALGLDCSIGRTSHNEVLQNMIRGLPDGASDIRVNQQQVNALGQRVGINRPDLQYTVNGQRHYFEFEGLANPRGAEHESRILANDPFGAFGLRLVE